MKNTAVLLSGGVDSSVALKLLKEQGHNITAFYLKIWLEDELAYLGNCPWEQDLSYVKKVCEKENIPLQIIPLQQEYFDKVVSYAIAEIKAGRTPNPDIFCNHYIKFGSFLDYIDDSFDYIASGHYAKVITNEDGTVVLTMSPDAIKDQTYFLSYLTQEQLKCLIFPLGDYTKEQVRELAQQFDLPTKDRKDSQGICFLGKLKFTDFIAHYLGTKVGDLIEFETGNKLGTHNGFYFYTIGQRQGLRLAGGPWYVVKKDPEKNIVYISRTYYDADKKRDSFIVKSCNWISGTAPDKKNLHVKMRHGAKKYDCTLELLPDNSARVTLQENDQGIAPGQFAVFYDDTICLGAGVIDAQL